jgi:hypothetical protein
VACAPVVEWADCYERAPGRRGVTDAIRAPRNRNPREAEVGPLVMPCLDNPTLQPPPGVNDARVTTDRHRCLRLATVPGACRCAPLITPTNGRPATRMMARRASAEAMPGIDQQETTAGVGQMLNRRGKAAALPTSMSPLGWAATARIASLARAMLRDQRAQAHPGTYPARGERRAGGRAARRSADRRGGPDGRQRPNSHHRRTPAGTARLWNDSRSPASGLAEATIARRSGASVAYTWRWAIRPAGWG